ncbi:MAG: metallophosphoesterase, partial [Prolixibacteraceae bacterium]|nr:metallophosphoesterase [Prolixibacteraceae bacterium]
TVPYFILKLFGKTIKPFIYGGLIISTGIYISVIYGASLGKNKLQVKTIEIEVPDLPDSFEGFKIVQVSDIHLGSFFTKNLMNKTVIQINKIKPDILLFTGDLVNNFSNETNEWEKIFNSVSAKYGKYSVLGNHDYGDYFNWKSEDEKNENFKAIVFAYNELGFKLLRNESIPLILNTDTCYLVGVENWGHPPFPQYADLNKALLNVHEKSFTILMTHDPAHWEIIREKYKTIDLSLSGHTHGLQWGIKPAGIEFSLIKAGSQFWGGLYNSGKQYLYVNRGLGTIGMNLRLDMPAEITIITLKKK